MTLAVLTLALALFGNRSWHCSTSGILALVGVANAQAQSSIDYFQVVDGDDDGAVSLAEFQAWMSRAFHKMDGNHDRILDPDEQLIPNAPRITFDELQQRLALQFERQDRDHNGQLSAAEYLAPPQ